MVSVIVPIYNSAKYLERCIESIKAQSIADLEIILINDGSTDDSKMLCEKISQEDNRIKFIDQANSGVSAARNRGLKTATGEYVCFVDSDDYIDRGYVESMLSAMVDNGSDFVISGRTQVKLDHTINLIAPPAKIMQDDSIREIFTDSRFDYVRGGPCCKLFKKEIIDKYKLEFPLNVHYLEDAIFVLDYLLKCKAVTSIDEAHYFYELHSGSLVFSVHSADIESMTYLAFKQRHDWFTKHFKLSDVEQRWFNANLDFIIHRQLTAISKEENWGERIKMYSSIDWAKYRQINASGTLKKNIVNILTYFDFGRILLSSLKLI